VIGLIGIFIWKYLRGKKIGKNKKDIEETNNREA
jgi:hypothetical protein